MKQLALLILICGFLTGTANIRAETSIEGATHSDVFEEIAGNNDLTAFARAVVLAGVDKEINDGRSYSIFAPVNDVFEEMDPGLLAKLEAVENRDKLQRFVRMHIVPRTEYLVNITGSSHRMETLSQDVIIARRLGKAYYINGRKVLSTDMHADGIMYELDGLTGDITHWEFKEPDPARQLGDGLRILQ